MSLNHLVYVGSPFFPGVGIINQFVNDFHSNDNISLVDGIIPGLYPEIKNFDLQSFMLWRLFRGRQFRKSFPKHDYIYLNDLIKSSEPMSARIDEILDISLNDHSTCNGFSDAERFAYENNFKRKYRIAFEKIYGGFLKLLLDKKINVVTVFNGRNPAARLLIEAGSAIGVKINYLELFGQKDGAPLYISSCVNFFNTDLMSEFILKTYRNDYSNEKDKEAVRCLDERVNHGDHFLDACGVDTSLQSSIFDSKGRRMVLFLFSSEDEYPAFFPSKFGFQPPNRQYETFEKICSSLKYNNLTQKYKIVAKLHPRYVGDESKLNWAKEKWDRSIDKIRSSGVDLQVIQPTESVYGLIKQSDMVFAYGLSALEATFLGKTSVLMGPNHFSSHDCCYIANSVEDVVSYLNNPPPPKSRESCYPFAWAWRCLGNQVNENYIGNRSGLFWKVMNRFSARPVFAR